jgi:hypothetical protein
MGRWPGSVPSSPCLEACHQDMAPMPASRRITLTPVQIQASPVRVLPTSGSNGQLLV